MKKQLLILTSVGGLALLNGFSLASLAAPPAADHLITPKSVGPVKLGMTVATARKLLKGLHLERASDGDGAALIAATRGKQTPMVLYAGESDASAPIQEKAKIENIEVTDSSYATKAGVHPGMLLKDAEKFYGKVKVLEISEIEAREYVTFTSAPEGLAFRCRSGEGGVAGRYAPVSAKNPNGGRSSKTYVPTARIYSIYAQKFHD